MRGPLRSLSRKVEFPLDLSGPARVRIDLFAARSTPSSMPAACSPPCSPPVAPLSNGDAPSAPLPVGKTSHCAAPCFNGLHFALCLLFPGAPGSREDKTSAGEDGGASLRFRGQRHRAPPPVRLSVGRPSFHPGLLSLGVMGEAGPAGPYSHTQTPLTGALLKGAGCLRHDPLFQSTLNGRRSPG